MADAISRELQEVPPTANLRRGSSSLAPRGKIGTLKPADYPLVSPTIIPYVKVEDGVKVGLLTLEST